MIYKARNSGSPIVKCAFLVNRYAGLVGFTLNLAYMFSVVPHSICRKVSAVLALESEVCCETSARVQSSRLLPPSDPLDTRCPCHDYGEWLALRESLDSVVRGCLPNSFIASSRLPRSSKPFGFTQFG